MDLAANAANQMNILAYAELDLGYDTRAVDAVSAALQFAQSYDVKSDVAHVLAQVGDEKKAQSLMADVVKERPDDGFIQTLDLPAFRAQLDIRHKNPSAAIQDLAAAAPYEAGRPRIYLLRGQAYLAAGKPADAAAEFKKVLARRDLKPLNNVYALAQLGLARAYAASGDAPGARTAYQDLFALWKDADPDVPVLLAARAEYAKLK